MTISRRMIWAGHVATHKTKYIYIYIFGNFEGTRPLGNLRHEWANCNMEMDFQEM
jgi:hypothetical protein